MIFFVMFMREARWTAHSLHGWVRTPQSLDPTILQSSDSTCSELGPVALLDVQDVQLDGLSFGIRVLHYDKKNADEWLIASQFRYRSTLNRARLPVITCKAFSRGLPLSQPDDEICSHVARLLFQTLNEIISPRVMARLNAVLLPARIPSTSPLV